MLRLPRNSVDLKAWRTDLGLTQVRAARILGIGRRTYQSYELGEKKVPWILSLACAAISQDPQQAETVALTVETNDDDFYSLI